MTSWIDPTLDEALIAADLIAVGDATGASEQSPDDFPTWEAQRRRDDERRGELLKALEGGRWRARGLAGENA